MHSLKLDLLMNALHPCISCAMEFNISQNACPFCDFPSQKIIDKRSLSKLACSKCSFENDLSNDLCVACDSPLFQNKEEKVKCDFCHQKILKRLIEEHSNNCMLSLQMIQKHKKEQQQLQKSEINCKFCALRIPAILIEEHNQVCQKKPKQPLKIKPVKPVKPIKPPVCPKPFPFGHIKPKPLMPHPEQKPNGIIPDAYQKIQIPSQIKQQQLFSPEQIARLTKLQKNAIMYMQVKSLKSHKNVEKQLQQRILKLGYKKQDLENLLNYIQNYAPIIIHIHITKHMQFFVKDTHYRNQFQTNKSSGSLSRQSRTEWENRMFDKMYAKATDHERVKYGVINFTNDPKGVNCASGYGISYFLLKEHVRNRCTVTDMDSSSPSSLIGTFRFCFHIVNKMTNQELKSAFRAAMALQESSSVTSTYKQMQIHGPIEFAKDIQRVYVNKKEVQDKKYLDMVYTFCERNKIDYQFI